VVISGTLAADALLPASRAPEIADPNKTVGEAELALA
jgi:hypothetical protein